MRGRRLLRSALVVGFAALIASTFTQPTSLAGANPPPSSQYIAPSAWTEIPVYDTAWQIFAMATPQQVDDYFAALKAHGFTGAWAGVIHHAPATYAHTFNGGGVIGSLVNGEVVLSPDYINRVNAILDKADSHGMKVGLVVAWQNLYLPGGGADAGNPVSDTVRGTVTVANAAAYGQQMVDEFGHHPAVSMWIFGGDAGSNNTEANKEVWRVMAAAVRAAGSTLDITYHTPTSSFDQLNYAGETWLDFISPETGHSQDAAETEAELIAVANAYQLPVWQGEPRYFNINFTWVHPDFRNPGAAEVVADAQAAENAGVAGYVYGDAGRWNWCQGWGDSTPCDANNIAASFGAGEAGVIDVFANPACGGEPCRDRLTVFPTPTVCFDSTLPGSGGVFLGDESRVIDVAGQGECVPEGASSVVLTVSAMNPLTEGNLRMWATGEGVTGAGVVNYGANGLDNANTVVVPVSSSGSITVEANAGSLGAGSPTTDVRLVAVGHYSLGADPALRFFPLNPCPVADSRTNKGAGDAFDGPANDGLWPVGSAFPDVDVVGVFGPDQGGGNGAAGCGVPASANAVLVNVVAVNMEGGSGHLSVGTGGADPVDEAATPFAVLTPKMNNGATTIVNTGPGGTIAIDIDGDPLASTMIRVEVLGYYDDDSAGLDFFDVAPCAVFDTRTNNGRLAAGVFAGERAHGAAHTTTYQVTGDAITVDQGGIVPSVGDPTIGTCGVPDGASAVLINLEAVNALREGNFWVSEAGTTTTGGVLNFNNVVPKMNNANTVVVPLSAPGELDLEINAGQFASVGTDVAHARGIVFGYYN